VIEHLLEAERALSFGRIDRAEEVYKQVAESDPRNSIAVVGLARVALERADDLGAYLLARRALTIDPENDAARRLAQRLEEVLATRGEPVDDPLPAQAARAPQPAPVEPTSTVEPAPSPPTRSKRRSLVDRLRRR
jgi:thioredoxin-like negative regulator of GroEL